LEHHNIRLADQVKNTKTRERTLLNMIIPVDLFFGAAAAVAVVGRIQRV
jgi:hypothetical protein